MLEERFKAVYLKFKLNFYKRIFAKFEVREASLTAVETFCAEIIHALNAPTVNEFAQFVNISAQNATHKINSLVRKGYVIKQQSPDDRREYRLSVTDKFFTYYNMSMSYVDEVIRRLRNRLPETDLEAFERVLTIIGGELTPEVDIASGVL
ncbi:MAG: MarR family transcriptional regulator [Oscillospiraceae bacterium]|jgi:DNA-binding MarR family transcriptional regulator|nr:MarR family transcriptional regulator [Oscillospiraceae bacterium]